MSYSKWKGENSWGLEINLVLIFPELVFGPQEANWVLMSSALKECMNANILSDFLSETLKFGD